MFARTASRFSSSIEVVKGGERVDGKSILSILTLVAEQGTELSIEANGPDAQDALRALVELVERGFEEEGQQSAT
jgi:phosphocarrier protein